MPLFFDSPVYLVDFAAYKPPEDLKAPAQMAEEGARDWPMYSEEMKDFMWKVFVKSGLGAHATYLPPAINPGKTSQPKSDVNSAMAEARMVIGGCVTELLQRTNTKATDIDILISTSSIFCSTPSMASLIINMFKLRSDVQAWHCGGMGCAFGTLGTNLISDLFKARPNSVALFVTAEIITAGFYTGNDKNRMIANTIFRMGASAMLLSNKPQHARVAKYRLEHAVRHHMANIDEAYQCMHYSPDAQGINGVYLGKDLVKYAGQAIETVVRMVTPKIMTYRQYGEAAVTMAKQYLGADIPDYQPDFTQCVDHFLIHAGGYAVLKSIQSRLKLPSSKMLPSFAALREYGNTSASTTWYGFGYVETCVGVKKGQRVLQLGVGGGIKGGVNIWRALRDIPAGSKEHQAWAHLAGHPLTEADLPRGIDIDVIRHERAEEILSKVTSTKAAPAFELKVDARIGSVQPARGVVTVVSAGVGGVEALVARKVTGVVNVQPVGMTAVPEAVDNEEELLAREG